MTRATLDELARTIAQGLHDDRGAFCNHGHFFRSGEVASTWQVAHQDAVLLPVEEAYQLGRLVLKHQEALLLRGQEVR
jgi:hypothetical protein